MKLINHTPGTNLNYSTLSVFENGGALKMQFTSSTDIFLRDDEVYIDNFSPQIKTFSYNSVLIGGLGLGLMPFYIQENKSVSIIDVVESNPDVISAVNSIGHLNSNVNIIQDNFMSYTPSKSYDLIIIDLWWGSPTLEPNYQTEIENSKTLYSSYLNENGKIYIPLAKYFE